MLRLTWRSWIAFAVCAFVSVHSACVHEARGAVVSWDDGAIGNFNWSFLLNWSGNQSPSGNDVFIGNLAAATGDSTIIDQDFSIFSLNLSNGADADTAGNLLSVDGAILISGAGSSFIASEHASGAGVTVTQVDDITISNSGAFVMNGGQVVVNELGVLDISLVAVNANSFLSGHGVLRLDDFLNNETDLLVNDGTLQSQRPVGALATEHFTLAIEGIDSDARLDLDGASNSGVVKIRENTTLKLGVEAQVFRSTMTLDAGSVLYLADPLFTNGATININAGFGSAGVERTATVRGARIGGNATHGLSTQYNVNSGTWIHEEGFNLVDPSAVNLAANTTLVIDNLGASAAVSSIHGELNFNGTGTELIVERSSVEISTPSWDWDGPEDATTTINNNGRLTITSDDISPSAVDDSFDGTININQFGKLSPDIPGGWTFSGAMNLDSSGGGLPTVESTERMTVDGGLITAVGGLARLDVPILFTSDATGATSVPSSATLEFRKDVTFNGGSTHTGQGTMVFRGGVNRIDGPQTFNMTGGIVQLTGNLLGSDVWLLNDDLTINASSLGIFGGNIVGADDAMTISQGTKLTVNLDSAAGEWTLGARSITSIFGGATVPTVIAGSDVNIAGDVVVTDSAQVTARIDFEAGGRVIINTPGEEFRLAGGTISDVNRIHGGEITGQGTLSAANNSFLVGHGTIDTDVDFFGFSRLFAEGGTLAISGQILDADMVGTSDSTGVLSLAQDFDTVGNKRLSLNGGEVRLVGATLFNNTTVQGHGRITSDFFRNNGTIIANGNAVLEIDTVHPINLDGTTENGVVEATNGSVRIVNSLNDHFGGTITVGDAFIEFEQAWDLGTNGVLNLHGVGPSILDAARLLGAPAALRGEVSVLKAARSFAPLTLHATSTTTLSAADSSLQLLADSEIRAGASISGLGQLLISTTGVLALKNGADVDVTVKNSGVVSIGDSPGFANVAAFEQIGSGTLNIEIAGADSGEYDVLFVDQTNAVLNGELDVSLIGGFTPSEGDAFPILQVLLGTASGTFDTVEDDLPSLPGGLEWFINYNPSFVGVSLEVVGSLLEADFDADGDVDGDDFLAWQGGFGTKSGAIKSDGDYDNDGDVDGDDFLGWQSEFGSGAGQASAPVPEPASWLLATFATIIALKARRYQNCRPQHASM